MNARPVLAALGIIMVAFSGAARGIAQGGQLGQSGASGADLRRDIERRFDVLPLRDGLALRPKSSIDGIRSIELTDGTIAIDGVPVTGGELRDKLGSVADLVMRLSYLDPNTRRTLLGVGGPSLQPSPEVTPPGTSLPSISSGSSPETATRTPRARPTRARHGDRVRFGGSVRISEDEIIEGDVVAVGGSVTVDGEVTGDVVAIGGAVELGPHAVVGKDIAVIGGSFHRADGARIDGKLNEFSAGGIDFRGWRPDRRLPSRTPFAVLGLASTFRLASTIARLLVLSVLVSIVILLGHEYVERVAARVRAEPFKAGLVGFLAQLLFLPLLVVTIVALVVTIVGIPLLALIPFALLALAVVFLIGFSAVAYDVGRFVASRMGWSTDNRYATAIIGILVIVSPLLIGRMAGLVSGLLFPLTLALGAIGFACEYVAWTVGFGAVALLRFEKTPQSTPQT